MKKILTSPPNMQGSLYQSDFEHDNCGAGFVCSLKGVRSNDIIHKALQLLERMGHRGAVSSDGRTGDGAGVLLDIPHEFFVNRCDFTLPNPKDYAVGMVYLPSEDNQANYVIAEFEKVIKKNDVEILGWRDVPVDSEVLGVVAAKSEPKVKQLFVKCPEGLDDLAFRKKIFVIRKTVENAIYGSKLSQKEFFYLPSFSNTTLIYKGLLVPEDIPRYFQDLGEEDFLTRMALVHQRFATNTIPAWHLAQPFRYMCHNGEINTLRGNVSRMRAREELFTNENFGGELNDILPIILPGRSDSASMDMVIEMLTLTGRTLPEVMMMMVPEAWEKHVTMSADKKAFYEYNSCIMEPWDGPSSIPFTDGQYLGALLDRNGLRPSRYTVTKDGYVIMSSETGVIEVDPANVERHGRLEPGKMFLVDMEAGKIIDDQEIKAQVVKAHPYGEWLKSNRLELKDFPEVKEELRKDTVDLSVRKKAYGYTTEHVNSIIVPMVKEGKEPLGAMGIDTPIAVLSNQNQLLYNYFKQMFAQVTNPPLDGIREEIVTDISLALGEDHNLFDVTEEQCKKLRIQNPILTSDDLNRIKNYKDVAFQAQTLSILFPKIEGTDGMIRALNKLVDEAEKALNSGVKVLILSDRGMTEEMAPLPALLATSYVHHTLNLRRSRSSCEIIVDSAEPREIHHFACLFGYGASAVCPYMVYEILDEEIVAGRLVLSKSEAVQRYQKSVATGVVKVMNKIGISTLHSYRTAQLFEAVGLSSSFCNRYFTYTTSRIEGAGVMEVFAEIDQRMEMAFPLNPNQSDLPMNVGGEYRWRRNGEKHLFNPLTVSKLQEAVREKKPVAYKEYAAMINQQSENLMTIRGLMEFNEHNPIDIDEVEPWTEIVKRFKTGAMSYGSISEEAHTTLAIAMNRLGGKSNSGEGGENPSRFNKEANGDWKNSAIKQVASGRFGVSSHYLSSAKEIQIKMAQGAKPGEGGQLPGEKVYPWIAECRNSTPWVGLISPPPHHDIYSIEDLAQLIYDLKNANREARINVKLVSGTGIGTIASGVAKAKADVILISGYDGGTGASPMTSLKHCGLPWELGLAEAQQTLVMNDLRSRVVLECDGQLKTGRDVAIAALLGAEEFGFATGPLVATGCIMMRVCHKNTCPVGIATQNPELRKKFKGTPEHVINFFFYVAEEIREIMAQLGFRTMDEMVGRVDKLKQKENITHFKARRVNLDRILRKIDVPDYVQIRNTMKQDHGLENVMDIDILEKCKDAIVKKDAISLDYKIRNTDRTVGAIVSHEISKLYGKEGLPEDTLSLNFKGSAGQSFAAFAQFGLTMTLTGEANDYIGKSLSGAKVIVKKPEEATYKAEENVIIGNVAFYGATQGEAYINGLAGERFCVRNSGVKTVVEGIGDHGCEYMTGGIVICLGSTGRNFAAGMSGGIAYVLDEAGDFTVNRCNTDLVDFDPIEDSDKATIKEMIEKHVAYTNSELGKSVLADLDTKLAKFIKVMPRDYKAALQKLEEQKIVS